MTRTNFSLRIKRLPFSRMLKSELADFVEKTIAIVENHDLESDLVTPVYAQLKAKEADVKLLRLSYGIDVERLRADKLKADLMLKISTIKLKVRLLKRSNLAIDLHVVENAIHEHLRYLNKCKNDKKFSQKVAGFFDVLDTNAELNTAFGDLDLVSDADTMKSAFNELQEAWLKRVRMLSQRPIVSTKAVVKGMVEAIDNLFKGVEVGHLLSTLADADGPEALIDFIPLIDELNQLSEMYNRSISLREANNKRKALLGDDAEGENEGEPTNEGEIPEEDETNPQ